MKEGRKTGGWEGAQCNLLHSWAGCEAHLSSLEWSTSITVYFLLKWKVEPALEIF